VRAHIVDPITPIAINEPLSNKQAPVYRALFRKASMSAAIMKDPPRRAGETDDDNPNPTPNNQKPAQTAAIGSVASQ
jgi:hypothetical protein